MNLLLKKSEFSLYHSLGLSAARFMYCVLTFERSDMDLARDTIRKAIEISNKKRRRINLSEYFWGSDVNDYTEEEIHAELCYAENHIMYGFLTFAQDQSIFALIKAAYRIKVGNDTYNACQQILQRKKEWKSVALKKHFEGGVCTGVGTSNLILSHLPSRLIKVLKWVGFSGDRHEAIRNLKAAASIKDGLRYKIVALITISFNLYMEQYYGLGKGDIQWSRELIFDLHNQFPKGVLVLAFLGRLRQLSGDTDQAIECFQEALRVPIEWIQVHNICFWELTWCYAMKGMWKEAADQIGILRGQSNWSKCIQTHIYASLLYMHMLESGDTSLREEITHEMNEIPKLRRRIGGKTVPVEKLAIYTSARYFRENETLHVPIYEVFYFYNILSHTGGKAERIDPILANLEKAKSAITSNEDVPEDKMDNYCLVLLLKGACLRYKKCYKQAAECFAQIIQIQDKIKQDTYIPPHAALELGITYVEMDKLSDAKEWLEKSRSEYKGFLIEAMLHLRTHAAFREINDREATRMNEECPSNQDCEGLLVESNNSSAGDIKRPSGFGSWIKSFV